MKRQEFIRKITGIKSVAVVSSPGDEYGRFHWAAINPSPKFETCLDEYEYIEAEYKSADEVFDALDTEFQDELGASLHYEKVPTKLYRLIYQALNNYQ